MSEGQAQIEIYTDGACLGNPGPGGWAALLRAGGTERELVGGDPATTNNRMELMAAIEALRALRKPCRVRLFTDSTYVQQGMTQWVRDWVRRGWRTAAKAPVKNADLWQALVAAAGPHQVDWVWVKAHAGNPDNERVDRLARAEATTFAVAGGARSRD